MIEPQRLDGLRFGKEGKNLVVFVRLSAGKDRRL
jgi:hypothetical protein